MAQHSTVSAIPSSPGQHHSSTPSHVSQQPPSRQHPLTEYPSLPHPKILLLHLLNFPNNAHHQHRRNPTHNPIRERLRTLPPSHAPLLPIHPLRAHPHHRLPGSAHRLRHCPPALPSAPASASLRCGVVRRATTDPLAARVWDVGTRLRARAACCRTRFLE